MVVCLFLTYPGNLKTYDMIKIIKGFPFQLLSASETMKQGWQDGLKQHCKLFLVAPETKKNKLLLQAGQTDGRGWSWRF